MHSVGAVVSENLNGYVVRGAPDESTPWKNIASDHPTVLLSAAFSQWLVWCLDYLYLLHPPI
jgi:hypothetical protein